MLPNFIVIGAAKCATTSVCELLGKHPQVFMSDPKEPHYFAIEDPDEFEAKLGWYESLFAGAGGAVAIGEGSVSFTHPLYYEFAAQRLHRLIPDCRLIYMVRHPIRALESGWKMLRHERRVTGSINDVFEQSPNLAKWGHYWRFLGAYRSLFSDQQILVVFFEDFVQDPHRELSRLAVHIGVDPSYSPDDAHRPRNPARGYRRLRRLGETFRQMPGFARLRRIAPKVVVERGRLLLTRRESFEVEWNPTVLRQVSDRYREDTNRLLAHCGKPADFWDLDV